MKHLFSKIPIYGAGWKPKKPQPPEPPPPARLEPPKLGNYQIFSSHSNAELIDLLCEGPIHGLVNAYGRDVDHADIMQGIYYDDTPIAISTIDSMDEMELFADDFDLSQKLKNLASVLSYNQPSNKSQGYFPNLFATDYTKGASNDIDTLNYNTSVVSISLGEYRTSTYRDPAVLTYTIETATPNFNAGGWSNANFNTPGYILYKYNEQMHLYNNTLYSQWSSALIASSNFQHLVNSQSTNVYEKELIKEKIHIINTIFAQNSNLNSSREHVGPHPWRHRSGPIYSPKVHRMLYIVHASDTFDKNSFKVFKLNNRQENVSCLDDNGNLKTSLFYFNDINPLTAPEVQFYDCMVPEINNNNEYTGRVYGFYAFLINCDVSEYSIGINTFYGGPMDRQGKREGGHPIPLDITKSTVSSKIVNLLSKSNALKFEAKSRSQQGSLVSESSKYNFSNVAFELKKGNFNQTPLSLFNKVYIDTEFNSKLLGPFRPYGQVQRFRERTLMLTTAVVHPTLVGGEPSLEYQYNVEGSLDSARQSHDINFHAGKSTFDEEAIGATHIIENENIESIYVTLRINELKDTLTKQMDIDGSAGAYNGEDSEIDKYHNYRYPEKRANIGSDLPTVVKVRIETGKIKDEKFSNQAFYDFDIYGYIPAPVFIDFGNPNNIQVVDFIRQGNRPNQPFELPTLLGSENPSQVKRYVRVYKVSTETNSVLIRKEVYLSKITEIINTQLSYPYCALIGNKIDARSLSSIPLRSYDCRLKRIKIPQNYHIIKDGYDKRYRNDQKEYQDNPELIYNGDWNGKFKMGWTDNPAWILYDMLTNKRYGLGQYIEESQINVWELYKIGRYCDSVDDNGFFIGVPDGRGGLEPRFSCNILFTQATKIFDAINMVANLFRGSVFFSNSEINFVDDRPKEPIALFTNSNVKDAAFNYISNKKDDIFNIVEVAYLDKNDSFKTKIEYVEDPEDIRNRRPQRTVINTVGVTSKSMARRIGQHAIWQTTKENQGVEFVAGLESLLCRPGDLIIVDDDLKNRKINCGRILDIDINNRQLRLDNPYDENNFNGYIELYTPTGKKTKEELTDLTHLARKRFNSFEVVESFKSEEYSSLTGKYTFSKYIGTQGFYTGQNKNIKTFCYYDEDLVGWVFSTGLAFQKNNIYDKVLSNATRANVNLIKNLYQYNVNNQRPQGKEIIANPLLSTKFVFSYQGISDSSIFDNEITLGGVRQISKYQISSVITNILDGAIVTLNEDNFNLNLLKFIQPGSTYRCQLKNTENQIYKVISIREESQNEYRIVGTKYDTGKWSYIENDTAIEDPQEIFYSETFNQVLQSLPAPHSLYLDVFDEKSSSFSITGSFKVSRGDLFKIKIENKAVNFIYELETDQKSFNITGLNDLGMYDLVVQNVSTNSNSLNSYPSQIQKFIGYQKTDVSDYDRPFIQNFTIT